MSEKENLEKIIKESIIRLLEISESTFIGSLLVDTIQTKAIQEFLKNKNLTVTKINN